MMKVGLNKYLVNKELLLTTPIAPSGEEHKAGLGPPLDIIKLGLNEYMVSGKRIKSNIPAPPVV